MKCPTATVTPEMVGLNYLNLFGRCWYTPNHFGPLQPRDVGKIIVRAADDVLQIENDEQRNQRLRRVALQEAIEAVLLFHSGGPWDDEKQTRWREITGHKEATTKVLCDHLRSVHPDEQQT